MSKFVKYTIAVLIGTTVILLAILLMDTQSNNQSQNNALAIPTPIIPEAQFRRTESNLTKLQKTIIGKTTEQEVKTIPQINSEMLENGNSLYTYPSEFPLWPNAIIVSNGLVIYEGIVLPELPISDDYDSFSHFEEKYGQAEQMFSGSVRFGKFVNTYVYPTQGFAIVAAPYENKVYEIQKFIPTTIENYKTQFGQNLESETIPQGDQRI